MKNFKMNADGNSANCECLIRQACISNPGWLPWSYDDETQVVFSGASDLEKIATLLVGGREVATASVKAADWEPNESGPT